MPTQLSRTKAPYVSPIHSITLKDILGGMAGVDCYRQVGGTESLLDIYNNYDAPEMIPAPVL